MRLIPRQTNITGLIIVVILFFSILFLSAPPEYWWLTVSLYFSQSFVNILNDAETVLIIAVLIPIAFLIIMIVLGNKHIDRMG